MTDEEKDRIRRAEEIQLYTENRCQALEKENAELKEKLEMSEKIAADNPGLFIENCNLKAEIAELKKDKEWLDNTNNEQTKVILKLQEQIGKMKYCGNCKHNGSGSEIGENGDYTDYTCIQCDDFSTKENPYPNWELAE